MTTSFFFLLACFSTTSVPCTLVSMVCTGCSTISFTPTAAARWKTTSLRSISSASSGSLVTVSMTYEKPGRALEVRDVVDRAGRQVVEDHAPRGRARAALGEMRSDEAGAAGDERFHAGTRPFTNAPTASATRADVGVVQTRMERQRQQFARRHASATGQSRRLRTRANAGCSAAATG